jgi:hypothetical protein
LRARTLPFSGPRPHMSIFVSLAPWSPPLELDSPLQVPWHLASQPRRSLWDSSHLWLPFLLRQSLQDFCPKRHRLLRHAQPWPLLLHRLRSQTAHHPVSGWPHRLPTSVVCGSPPPWVPLHHPLFGHLLREVRAWWCLSRLWRILIGWSQCFLGTTDTLQIHSNPTLCLLGLEDARATWRHLHQGRHQAGF